MSQKPPNFKPLSAQAKQFTGVFASTSKAIPSKRPSDVIELSSDSDDVSYKRRRKDKIIDDASLPTPSNTSKKGKGKTVVHKDDQEQLWIDQYAPRDLDELAVHKKKVQDVRSWLTEALDDPKLAKYRRLLILAGPAGAAKTATMRCLSKEMDFELLEFRSGEGSDTLITQFSSFLARAAAVPTLDFGASNLSLEDTTPVASTSKVKIKTGQQTLMKERPKSKSQAKRKVILVEDLPNIFTSERTRASFKSALSTFVQHVKGYSAAVPLVLIITETTIKGSSDEFAQAEFGSWNDNLSVRNIVPVDVLRGGKATEIRFNAIAITFMRKGLNAILSRIYNEDESKAKKKGKQKRPSAEAVELVALAANGDIRNALNNLQFLAREGEKDSTMIQYSIMADVVAKAKKGKLKNISAQMIAGRESSLFLFHALGKVLYSKRWGEAPDDDAKDERPRPATTTTLPKHLKPFKRLPSKVEPNDLFADAPVDCDMFMAYLHQNYPPFTSDIEQCGNVMEHFSQADAIMKQEGERFSRHPLTSQYSFHVAVRGMLMSLPSPVPRKGQKMFKADIWEKMRTARDREATLGTLVIDFARFLGHKGNEADAPLQTLLTRRSITHELIPYLGIIKQPFVKQLLPAHTTSIITELTTYKLPESTRAAMLDEREDAGSDAESVDDAAIAKPEEAEEAQIDVKPDLLYLEDDDIED